MTRSKLITPVEGNPLLPPGAAIVFGANRTFAAFVPGKGVVSGMWYWKDGKPFPVLDKEVEP